MKNFIDAVFFNEDDIKFFKSQEFLKNLTVWKKIRVCFVFFIMIFLAPLLTFIINFIKLFKAVFINFIIETLLAFIFQPLILLNLIWRIFKA